MIYSFSKQSHSKYCLKDNVLDTEKESEMINTQSLFSELDSRVGKLRHVKKYHDARCKG